MDDSTRVVKDRNELKKAYEDKVDKIILTGNFAQNMKKAKVIRKLTPAKLAMLGAAITAAGGGIAMAPFTLGVSSVISVAAAAPVAVKTGLSIPVIIAVGSIGLTLLLAVFEEYDIIEAKKGDFKVVLRKRKKNKEKD